MGWTVSSSPSSYAEVLILCIIECDLIWKWRLYRDNQVKLRSLGWALIQLTWYLFKKRKFGPWHIERKKTINKQGEDNDLWAKEEKSGADSSLVAFRRNLFCWHLDLKLLVCGLYDTIHFCCLSTQCMVLCHRGPSKLIQMVGLEDGKGGWSWEQVMGSVTWYSSSN